MTPRVDTKITPQKTAVDYLSSLFNRTPMKLIKSLHFYSGMVITLFVAGHLWNHIMAIFGPEAHLSLMNDLRVYYRHPIGEAILLIAVFTQVISGLNLFWNAKTYFKGFFNQLQLWSGLYLALFFLIHVSAVLFGRYFFDMDTNFYFGVAGLNTFPYILFFVPYYTLAIFAFFAHLAAIHFKKMKHPFFGISVRHQSYVIIIAGAVIVFLTMYASTNGFRGFEIPSEYLKMIGG